MPSHNRVGLSRRTAESIHRRLYREAHSLHDTFYPRKIRKQLERAARLAAKKPH